ncbi:MAG TPA: OmpA family protein [Opitutaceae bacterium]|nr:OmpA family protein [Opitutaceae bacterium]
MKILPKFLALATASAALLLLTGCPKKPVRPGPGDTQAGTTPDTQVNPNPIFANPDDAIPERDLATVSDDGSGPGLKVAELQTVYFSFDRYAVEQSERAKLDTAAAWLKQNADKRIVLEGHCDWRGTAEYNLGLGDSRAMSVRKYLEFLGVPANRVETISKGDIDAKEGATAEEMKNDRRVDFYVLRTQP